VTISVLVVFIVLTSKAIDATYSDWDIEISRRDSF